MNIEKIKENVLLDWFLMIYKSWTWARLTDKEITAFKDGICSIDLKGTYDQRWRMLNELYHIFLLGCGYQPNGWRETDENAPLF